MATLNRGLTADELCKNVAALSAVGLTLGEFSSAIANAGAAMRTFHDAWMRLPQAMRDRVWQQSLLEDRGADALDGRRKLYL
jgi:hypothetical protein